MGKILKMKTLSKKSIHIDDDIKLINEYSIKKLATDEVFAFSLILCDNEVDRDLEKLDKSGLEKLSQLFRGKTGIFNHSGNANDQIARLYKVEVEATGEKNSIGEDKLVLRGNAYVLRNEFTTETIAKIEGGILKEVSVSFAVKECICSICGEQISWDCCRNGHKKGTTYDGKLCYGLIKNPTDAYEFSFVAIPAQRGAGVTKAYEDDEIKKSFDTLRNADIASFEEQLQEVMRHFKELSINTEEHKTRQEILIENKKYLKEKN